MENTPQNHISGQACYRKKTTQSNHDPFVIPASLQQYTDEPLYILVALWAQQQNDWVSRAEISEAFGITDRRASFQVSYISRKNRRITCETRAVRDEGSSCPHHEIRVTGVVLSGDTKRAVPVPPKNRPVKHSRIGNATPELRRLFHSLIGSQRVCED
ncbi:CaiF/GrlA family transcriptional regulator [Salmonella enterica subsp. enterica serovar Muenchen]|nr:CaiF/GrlA family transcriptional regulator [Salmonella enterica subsp. enterica serovar Muenchen]ECG0445852.1 CaiF/GrlA family transcriptional regulator [Salmonella enterica]ECJ4483021.1 CaiF/GrlA family transcriptional regulator [Salmonella enterica subsp. diarizonae]EBY3557653.1 CaiF/GrlA family transcriptional regulator [Salmonella enterica subsp. enterica serovar Muenchen]ECZ0254993.1 CaiF/GrlA family transcriptional regulator [Salmonella enterica subsp. diarizonae]